MVIGKIKTIANPFNDYYVIKITKDENLNWTAGQHGIFKINKNIEDDKNNRIFSFASIVEEGEIILGTRTGPKTSNFKKAFLALEEGTEIEIEGPMGKFTLNDTNESMVMIAGGVGITPIRSIYKELEKGNERNVELVYSSIDNYLFLDELQSVADKDEKVFVHTVTDPASTQAKIRELIEKYENEALYYISGSPGLINAIKGILLEAGIQENRIVFDAFMGY